MGEGPSSGQRAEPPIPPLPQAGSNEEDYQRFAGDASRKHVTVRSSCRHPPPPLPAVRPYYYPAAHRRCFWGMAACGWQASFQDSHGPCLPTRGGMPRGCNPSQASQEAHLERATVHSAASPPQQRLHNRPSLHQLFIGETLEAVLLLANHHQGAAYVLRMHPSALTPPCQRLHNRPPLQPPVA